MDNQKDVPVDGPGKDEHKEEPTEKPEQNEVIVSPSTPRHKRLWNWFQVSSKPVQALVFVVIVAVVGGGVLLVKNYALSPNSAKAACGDPADFTNDKGAPGKLAHSCRLANGLYKIDLGNGKSTQVHGADVVKSKNTAQGVATDVAASTIDTDISSAALAPTCATDYYGQIMYVVPYGYTASSTTAGNIRHAAEQANGFLHAQYAGQGFNIRYKMRCDSSGNPTVTTINLPSSLGKSPNFAAITGYLANHGYNNSHVKYWVWTNSRGGSDFQNICGGSSNCYFGLGSIVGDDSLKSTNSSNGQIPEYAVLFGEPLTGTWLPAPSFFSHEVGHNMGAVQSSAPDSDGNGHCTQAEAPSVMCTGNSSQPYACSALRYDCRGRDYFNPQPGSTNYLATHWNQGSRLNHFLSGLATTVSGHVYNSLNGKDIPGATIHICGYPSVTTNASGNWSTTVQTQDNYCAYVAMPSTDSWNPVVLNTSKSGISGDRYTGQIASGTSDTGLNFGITPPIWVGVGDVNKDGKADVVGAAPGGSLVYYKNTGSATAPLSVSNKVVLFATGGWDSYTNVIVADVNGDGYGDLLLTKRDGTLWYDKNTGSATAPFSATPIKIGSGFGADHYEKVTAGDVNGDGKADIIGTGLQGGLWLYTNTGSATAPFSATGVQIMAGGSGWDTFEKLIIGDLNGDRKADLLAAAPDGTMYEFLNTGNASAPFSITTTYKKQLGTGWNNYPVVVGGDVNGDGKVDLVTIKNDGSAWYYHDTGSATAPFNSTTTDRISMGTGFAAHDPLNF